MLGKPLAESRFRLIAVVAEQYPERPSSINDDQVMKVSVQRRQSLGVIRKRVSGDLLKRPPDHITNIPARAKWTVKDTCEILKSFRQLAAVKRLLYLHNGDYVINREYSFIRPRNGLAFADCKNAIKLTGQIPVCSPQNLGRSLSLGKGCASQGHLGSILHTSCQS